MCFARVVRKARCILYAENKYAVPIEYFDYEPSNRQHFTKMVMAGLEKAWISIVCAMICFIY